AHHQALAVHRGVGEEACLIADVQLGKVGGELNGHLGAGRDLDLRRRVQRAVHAHDDESVVDRHALHGGLAHGLNGAGECDARGGDELLQGLARHASPLNMRTVQNAAVDVNATSGMSTSRYSQPSSNSPVTTVTRKPSGMERSRAAAVAIDGRTPAST